MNESTLQVSDECSKAIGELITACISLIKEDCWISQDLTKSMKETIQTTLEPLVECMDEIAKHALKMIQDLKKLLEDQSEDDQPIYINEEINFPPESNQLNKALPNAPPKIILNNCNNITINNYMSSEKFWNYDRVLNTLMFVMTVITTLLAVGSLF